MINWPVLLVENKYSKWYNNLITKAQIRGKVEGYKEKHHIIPKSFGGSDLKSNLVELTAREHYIAHALLWKMRFVGIYKSKMSFAFNTFINKMQGNTHTYKINSRIYESFKIDYAKIVSEKMRGNGNPFFGRKHSEDTKRIIGEKSKLKEFKKGPDNPNFGKPSNISPEGKQRLILAIKERWSDPDFKRSMSEKRKAYFRSQKGKEQIEKNANARRGLKRDPVIIEKGASKRRGKLAHELFSPQALKNIKEGRKHRKITPEARQKWADHIREVGKRPKSEEFKKRISQAMTGIKRPTKTCEYCGIECVVSNYNRWHGAKCKYKFKEK